MAQETLIEQVDAQERTPLGYQESTEAIRSTGATRYERQLKQVELIAQLHGQIREDGYAVNDAIRIAKEFYAACGLEWIKGE